MLGSNANLETELRPADTLFHQAIRLLAQAPKPVVIAVQGWAAGAGMSIALAADIVLVGESARLHAAYPRSGFKPDGRRPELDAPPRVRTYASSGDHDQPGGWCHEAVSIGPASRQIADADLQTECLTLARSSPPDHWTPMPQPRAISTRAMGATSALTSMPAGSGD